MEQKLLSDLIQERISLGKASSTGFYKVKCEVCADHTNRAGFKFFGGVTGYNCFNCGAKFAHEESSGKLSREAIKILESFGISREDLNVITASAFFNKNSEAKEITMEVLKPPPKLSTPAIELPPHSHPLGSPFSEDLQAPLIEYLINRSLDPLVLNAHFSLDPKFLNRVILPCSRDDKIIFWQARTILADVKPRYLSPSVNKDAVLWGYDFLWGDQSKPLFITEGIFDAASINGVALLGSTLNESKLQILNRCRRRKIVVVDRDDRGSALAQLALENGWEITWPAPGAADVNTSVQKFGVLLTTWYLLKQATVPSSLVSADGISVQSKLSLAMQTLKIKRRK